MPAARKHPPVLGKFLPAALLCITLTACAPTPPPTRAADIYEDQNRATHRINKGLDQGVLRPVSLAYGTVVPGPVREGVSNFASNLGIPATVMNNLFQARLADAGRHTARFAVNSTVGLGGIFDVATRLGLRNDPSGFGETLYVWGAEEGAYLEVLALGPKTERDAVGTVVDFVINPLSALSGAERGLATGTRVASGIGDRFESSDIIDGILYDSADSYAQLRLFYLQNRRFELTGDTDTEEFDPYDDVYGAE